uniref:Uncharacterized protein n=1 Tax=Anopheles atroparvus TaxID=41427 RepID=A0A182IXW0_ANOAO
MKEKCVSAHFRVAASAGTGITGTGNPTTLTGGRSSGIGQLDCTVGIIYHTIITLLLLLLLLLSMVATGPVGGAATATASAARPPARVTPIAAIVTGGVRGHVRFPAAAHALQLLMSLPSIDRASRCAWRRSHSTLASCRPLPRSDASDESSVMVMRVGEGSNPFGPAVAGVVTVSAPPPSIRPFGMVAIVLVLVLLSSRTTPEAAVGSPVAAPSAWMAFSGLGAPMASGGRSVVARHGHDGGATLRDSLVQSLKLAVELLQLFQRFRLREAAFVGCGEEERENERSQMKRVPDFRHSSIPPGTKRTNI